MTLKWSGTELAQYKVLMDLSKQTGAKALKDLKKRIPATSNEPTQPTLSSELTQKELA